MTKELDKFLNNYKELFITQTKAKNHIYFFKCVFKLKPTGSVYHMTIPMNGIYIIDEFENKFINADFLYKIEQHSDLYDQVNNTYDPVVEKIDIFDWNYPMKFFDVYFQIDSKEQMVFRRINKNSNHPLVQIINSNCKNGTTRKFLTNSEHKKIEIELDFESVNSSDFIMIKSNDQTKNPIIFKTEEKTTFLKE